MIQMLKECIRASQEQTVALAVRWKGVQRKAIKVNISTQLSCLLPPPLPLSVVTVLPCSTVATPNRTYQRMGQWWKVLGGLLKLKECLLCGTERSEGV